MLTTALLGSRLQGQECKRETAAKASSRALAYTSAELVHSILDLHCAQSISTYRQHSYYLVQVEVFGSYYLVQVVFLPIKIVASNDLFCTLSYHFVFCFAQLSGNFLEIAFFKKRVQKLGFSIFSVLV